MKQDADRTVTSMDDGDALTRMADIYKSRYFGIENLREIGKPVNATITKAITEKLEDSVKAGRRITGGEKGVITVKSQTGREYEIVLNKTSFGNLRHAWSLDKSKWIGGAVVIALEKVNGKEATIVKPIGDHK